MEELKQDIRDIRRDIVDMKESQIRMEADVHYHIKRTDLNEEAIKLMAEKLQEAVDKLDVRMETIEKPAKAQQYMMKFIVRASKVVGLLTGLAVLARYMGKI